MKTKNLISITLKIIGLIAFWKSVQAFATLIGVIGIFSPLFTNNATMNNSFMFVVGLTMILNFVLPLAVAFLFIFRTKKVLSIIKITDQNSVDLNVNKHLLYHLTVIVFGFLIIIHGAGNFVNFNYKTDTNKEFITNNTMTTNQSSTISNQEKVTVTKSNSKTVNYFALIEIIIGIILLAKSVDISNSMVKRLDIKTATTTAKDHNIK